MAHLVSSDMVQLEKTGLALGLHPARLEFRPMKDPGSGMRRAAWHWDLVGPWVPLRTDATKEASALPFERSPE
jgi:hypothetical protein